ncbi:MAG TPA: orotidine-5'-phosphate decarboxylase [Gemmatimonadaceae bacterium]|nr:orotidine-5'-phosphate decarboxylase [Gemmatimonadaceae bacterium]
MRRARAIVALDVAGAADAVALAERLGDACDFVKVGSELFTAAGPSVVEAVRRRTEAGGGDRDVFLDLKLHDIPNTVRAAARRAAALGARLVTVHATGGREMLEAAADGAGDGCGVLAVTVLTSLDGAALGEAWGRTVSDVQAEVLRLSSLARSAGVRGVVCSGFEAGAVRAEHGDALEILVPGVRLAGSGAHDQKRVVTPGGAAAAGANYVVIGRTVTQDPDPRVALARVRAELLASPS